MGFDRLEMEQQMAELGKLMAEQDFEDINEANDFLRDLLAETGGQIPHREAETPQEKARELISQAVSAPERKARKLVKDALELDPDCVDAYVLRGEMAASLPETIAEFRRAVAAGERSLGAEVFEEDRGVFWGLIETRPYMRAMQNLAMSLWSYGEAEEAIRIYQEMLELNPNDNQGVRHLLLNALLLLRRHDEAAELLERFDDGMAHWCYNKALLLFRLEGRSDSAIEALKIALDRNEHVPEYLLGIEPMPELDDTPGMVLFGSESEAQAYVFEALPLWISTPGAHYWLQENMGF